MNTKKDFPIFNQKAKKPLIYLDSAATSQKPQTVIDAITQYYTTSNANIHRGLYKLSEESTKAFEDARSSIAQFINAQPNEIIFTKSCTESLNLLANSLEPLIQRKKNIVLTEMEHHANLIPWQQLAKRKNLELRFI